MQAASSLRSRWAPWAGGIGTVLLAAGASSVLAQVHEVDKGAYVLRSSTVGSTQFSAAMALRHGIEPAPDKAVINVVVLKAGKGPIQERNIPAKVTVSMRRPTGKVQLIDMREVREDNLINYLGPTGSCRAKP